MRNIFLFVLIFPLLCLSEEKSGHYPKSKKQTGKPYYGFEPYVPMKREYAVELGSMWEEQTLYWLGGRLGFHLGTCVFSQSQTCQQYWDVLAGVGGRDGYTSGLLLTGPRWQFINFPKVVSPSITLLLGATNLNDIERSKQELTYGLGFGWTMAVHEDLDLRVEFRAGGGDHEWSQAFIGLGVKIDNIVSYYAEKLDLTVSDKDIGGVDSGVVKSFSSEKPSLIEVPAPRADSLNRIKDSGGKQ